jgi:hypothetical protein
MSKIDDGFKKMLDGMRQADEGRDEVMRGLEEAWAGRKDLEETVAELKALILEQGQQIRALRELLG